MHDFTDILYRTNRRGCLLVTPHCSNCGWQRYYLNIVSAKAYTSKHSSATYKRDIYETYYIISIFSDINLLKPSGNFTYHQV
jgi:hypothetical protein